MSGGRRRRPAEMVQPGGAAPGPASASASASASGSGPGSGAEAGAGAAGDEAAAVAAGGVPAELGSAELLQRLLVENRELKAALRRCSEGLRGRCEELRRLQGLRRAERELLRGRAGQARALVERLRRQREPPPAPPRPGDTGGDSDDAGTTDEEPPPDPPSSLCPQHDQDDADVPDPPGGVPVPRPDPSSPTERPAVTDPTERLVTAEADPTEQLRQRLAATEAELVAARGAQAAAEEQAQAAAAGAELQLQALRRQLEQEKASVKAQVTSLLGELRESQGRLEATRRERDQLEQRGRLAAERSRALEAAAAGHALQLDQLRLQVQNLEAALRVERHGATEEKRKLVQLQVAYHHLFQEYDAHIKASLEGDKRGQGPWQELAEARARLQEAEEALAAKQELIDRLKGEAERHRAALDTLPVLQAQADIFRADFAAERAAREQLHAQREALQEEMAQLRLRLRGDPHTRVHMEEMRNRHSELRPPAPTGLGGSRPPPEEEPDLCCPKCQYKAPDMDTLQIHVMDCIK